jgi:hypothetical protein
VFLLPVRIQHPKLRYRYTALPVDEGIVFYSHHRILAEFDADAWKKSAKQATLIGTTWEFFFEEANPLIQLALDSGLGFNGVWVHESV